MKPEVIAEFVLTYSWGVLIAGMVISTMAVLGLLEWGAVITPSCEGQGQLACLEGIATNSSSIEFVVRSASNESIAIQTLSAQGNPPCGGIRNVTVNGGPLPAVLKPRDVARVIIQCSNPWAKDELIDTEVLVSLQDGQARISIEGLVGG